MSRNSVFTHSVIVHNARLPHFARNIFIVIWMCYVFEFNDESLCTKNGSEQMQFFDKKLF
jgi:hypothetical protein